MNILIVTLELAPFVQINPAAESVASLSKALRLLGHDVNIVAPRLSAYEESGVMAARQLSPLKISPLKDGGPERNAVLFDAQLSSGVKLTLVEVEASQFLEGQPLTDQAEALGAFSEAVAAYGDLQAEQGAPFDVVHAHDAGAGLALLKLQSVGAAGVGKVLTVHDARNAGEFSFEQGAALGISSERLSAQGFKSGEGICLLKGLVGEADAIVTPSNAYSRQLKAAERYGALSRAFHSVDLIGVIEGVDHAVYNPSTDPALASRYDAPSPVNKARNKAAVLKEMGLDLELSRPVIFCEDVKEGDSALLTVIRALPVLVRNDVTLIIAGPQELRAEHAALIEPFAKQVCWIDAPQASLRRRILAASDFYLSVQRRNPSGQRLLQASRYGAIPIALAVDSVTDLIVDCDSELHTGTGILFHSMTQRALVSASARAVAAYRSSNWRRLLTRTMRQDLAWDRSARRHVQIYRQVASATAGAS